MTEHVDGRAPPGNLPPGPHFPKQPMNRGFPPPVRLLRKNLSAWTEPHQGQCFSFRLSDSTFNFETTQSDLLWLRDREFRLPSQRAGACPD